MHARHDALSAMGTSHSEQLCLTLSHILLLYYRSCHHTIKTAPERHTCGVMQHARMVQGLHGLKHACANMALMQLDVL